MRDRVYTRGGYDLPQNIYSIRPKELIYVVLYQFSGEDEDVSEEFLEFEISGSGK